MDTIMNSLMEECKNLEADNKAKKNYQQQRKNWMNYI